MHKTTETSKQKEAIAGAQRLQHTLYHSINPTRRWLHQSRVRWIVAHAVAHMHPESGPIVDAGAGCGVLLPKLYEKFQMVIGIDKEPAFLNHAGRIRRRNKPHALLAAGDLRSLPLLDASAGLVICSEVLEHIKETRTCLDEIYRVLAPGGVLILSTPQPFSLVEIASRIAFSPLLLPLARQIYNEPLYPTGHINLMSMKQLAGNLVQTGFVIEKTHRSGLYLPGLSDIRSTRIQKITSRLNDRLVNTPLASLLWTQFFVARKPLSPESSRKQETSTRP